MRHVDREPIDRSAPSDGSVRIEPRPQVDVEVARSSTSFEVGARLETPLRDGAKAHTRHVLRVLFGDPERRDFAVRYWDGSIEGPEGRAGQGGDHASLTLVLNHPGALRRMLLPPSELRGAEAYIFDDIDFAGDVEYAAVLGEVMQRRIRPPRFVRQVLPHLLALPSGRRRAAQATSRRRFGVGVLAGRHSLRRDRASVRYHYDVGNDFFALFLDQRLIYSCAYFEEGRESLDQAQIAKLELTCRKLRLTPGDRLLDIGCGWGGLLLHAAQRYGVRALGITLSEPQAELARRRIAEAGLSDRCQVEVRDYRQLGSDKTFDKIVSIGMVEHVGHGRVGEYFGYAYRALRPGGLFLSHGIVTLAGARAKSVATRLKDWLWRGRGFIKHYVFPDSELLPLGVHVQAAEAAGFETRDVESLREHYAMTLRHWVRRLEANRDAAVRLAGEATYRVWRLYMAASAHQFATGRIGVQQLLLAKPDAAGRSGVPLTRSGLYSA
jgi:cyclopropane-fatty-acyl-phospholipid synthase